MVAYTAHFEICSGITSSEKLSLTAQPKEKLHSLMDKKGGGTALFNTQDFKSTFYNFHSPSLALEFFMILLIFGILPSNLFLFFPELIKYRFYNNKLFVCFVYSVTLQKCSEHSHCSISICHVIEHNIITYC